jgi:hypothetical protein
MGYVGSTNLSGIDSSWSSFQGNKILCKIKKKLSNISQTIFVFFMHIKKHHEFALDNGLQKFMQRKKLK